MMLLALAAALVAQPSPPQPGKLHLYKDWIVGCDNTRSCEAVALVPEDNRDPGDYLMLTVSRDGVPGAVAHARRAPARPYSGRRAPIT